MGEGISSYEDYRDLLKNELEIRLNRNPRYSLRAFARDLEIAPQNLSAIFKKKKGLSVASAARLASRLGMDDRQAEYFCDLVTMAHARSMDARKIATLRLMKHGTEPSYQVLHDDVFRAISAWYHFAILELTTLTEFDSNPSWISGRLGISLHEATQAIARLLRLGLLEQVGNRLRKTNTNIATTNDIPSASVRELTRQLLQKALDALPTQNVAERDMTTMTLAIDPEKIPTAKEMIRRFRRRLTKYLESGSRSEIYCFSSQLFRLTHHQRNERKPQ